MKYAFFHPFWTIYNGLFNIAQNIQQWDKAYVINANKYSVDVHIDIIISASCVFSFTSKLTWKNNVFLLT